MNIILLDVWLSFQTLNYKRFLLTECAIYIREQVGD